LDGTPPDDEVQLLSTGRPILQVEMDQVGIIPVEVDIYASMREHTGEPEGEEVHPVIAASVALQRFKELRH
jgi:hypothetical protein